MTIEKYTQITTMPHKSAKNLINCMGVWVQANDAYH